MTAFYVTFSNSIPNRRTFEFLSFISPKKNPSNYKVYGTQNDRLELTVSTQKPVWKNMHRVQRY